MSHLVIYTGLDGTVGYQPCNTLTDAVAQVESLRNDKGIDGSKIFKLDEIKFEVRPYYRVAIPGLETADDNEDTETSDDDGIVESSSASTLPPPVDAPASAVSALTTEVAALIAPPPPPPPAPAPIAPPSLELGDDLGEDLSLGNRRGLFGR